MPTKVYCYHVNDENKLMHICNDLMKGKRAMARVCWVGGSTEDWYWWLGKSNRYGRYIYANLVTTSKLTRELCPGILQVAAHGEVAIHSCWFYYANFRYGIYWTIPGEYSCPASSEYAWQRNPGFFKVKLRVAEVDHCFKKIDPK